MFAKHTRGLMTSWIIENEVKSPEKLSGFKEAGYRFNKSASTT